MYFEKISVLQHRHCYCQ